MFIVCVVFVHVFVTACVCVHIWVCMYASLQRYVCVYAGLQACLCVCVCFWMSMCLCVCLHLCRYTFMCICICVGVFFCVCVPVSAQVSWHVCKADTLQGLLSPSTRWGMERKIRLSVLVAGPLSAKPHYWYICVFLIKLESDNFGFCFFLLYSLTSFKTMSENIQLSTLQYLIEHSVT